MRTFFLAQPLLIISSIALAVSVIPPSIVEPEVRGSTITDMNGREIRLAPPAERVVIFPPVLWEYLALDPSPDRLAAVAGYTRRAARTNLLGQIFPAIRNMPVAITKGANTAFPGDPEDVLRHAPDAILSWDWLSESLRAVGAPVVQLKLSRRTEHHVNEITILRTIASVNGQPRRAEDIISRFHARVADIARNVEAARAATHHAPRALHASVRHGGQLYVEAVPFNQAAALKMAGAEIASVGRAGATDIEQLLIWDPDVIILSCCYGDKVAPKFFYDDMRFQTLSAVRNRRIYKAPSGGGNMDGLVEWPLFVSWLAEILYPDRMPRTFRADMTEAYRMIFGYQLSKNDLDKTLFLEENEMSAGYDRFQ